MQYKTSQDIKVLISQIDMNCQMGLMQTLAIVQDNMCEFFRKVECDGPRLIAECGCFYVLTKTKIHFDNFIKWRDVFNVSTKLHDLSRIAVTLDSELKMGNDLPFAKCYQELCVMDVETRKLRMVSETPFPTGIDVCGGDRPFERFNVNFDEADYCDSVKINSTSIDLYHHANNVEYVRFILSTFEPEFFANNRIVDFEIHYSAESRYGDILKIYRKVENDVVYFELRCEDGKVTTKAKLTYLKCV